MKRIAVAAWLIACGACSSAEPLPAPFYLPGYDPEPAEQLPLRPDAWDLCEEPPDPPAPPGDVPLRIEHEDEMGVSFRATGIAYALDERCLFRWDDDGGRLTAPRRVVVYDGGIEPGWHRLKAVLRYRNRVGFGVFSSLYVQSYIFTLRDHRDFAVEGRTTVRVVGYEGGTTVTPLEDRPAVRFELVEPEVTAGY